MFSRISALRARGGARISPPAAQPAFAMALANELAALREFEAKHGRPLRVLHVGNIANNAFLNAKFLRSVGVEADVLCYNYTHVMALPEWEEVELLLGHGDDNNPHFSPRDLRGYRRPRWFFQGPLAHCVQDIEARFGIPKNRFHRWIQGAVRVPIRLIERRVSSRFANFLSLVSMHPRVAFIKMVTHCARQWVRLTRWRPRPLMRLTRWVERQSMIRSFVPPDTANHIRARFWTISKLFHHHPKDPPDLTNDLLNGSILRYIADFQNCFPDRPDRLTYGDIAPYYMQGRVLRAAFKHYDIVQCYATEPLHAMVSDTRPYVAFEHGTLRDFTMGDNPIHRLTALSYRVADHCFITNGDCLDYAKRLDIPRYSPIIHPIDVEQHRQNFKGDIKRLRREIGGEVILFCPVRHDWSAKGTDVHLRALPIIKARVGKSVKLVLVRWGAQLEDSERLIAETGCTEDVAWRGSMCRITMIKHIRAADVVLDQMALPHFGATAPQSLAAGTPVISSYDPESTRWIIPEPAPIIPAHSPEQVADAVVTALDAEWRIAYQERARRWIDTYHHPNNVIVDHLAVYRRILENDGQRHRT